MGLGKKIRFSGRSIYITGQMGKDFVFNGRGCLKYFVSVIN